MIKKMLLTVIGVLLFTMAYAQGQEDHVVRRGRYKAAVTTTVEVPQSKLYHSLSAGFVAGSYNVVHSVVSEYQYYRNGNGPGNLHDPSYYSFTDEQKSLGKSTSAMFFTVSYNLMYRLKSLYVGPGALLLVGKDLSPSLYLGARYEVGTGKYHPYISAAAGINWLSNDKELVSKTFSFHYQGKYVRYFSEETFSSDEEVKPTGGLRPHVGFGGGITIDVGDHSSIIIGYQALLRPMVTQSFNIMQYKEEIDQVMAVNFNTTGIDFRYPVNITESMVFYHGMELTFRF